MALTDCGKANYLLKGFPKSTGKVEPKTMNGSFIASPLFLVIH